MYDVNWRIGLEAEVAKWLNQLDASEFSIVSHYIERLAEHGNSLRMPTSRALGGGLFELRFNIDQAPHRITYIFTQRKSILLLTAFTKQRRNERHEIKRARTAMKRCLQQRHNSQEEK